MGELGSGDGSSFPESLDTNSILEVDSPAIERTLVRADIPNDIAAAIIAIETELGINPAGSLVDLKTRLAVSLNDDGSIKDPELSAIAGLVSAADKLAYFTGSGTASLADLTAAARSLLDDANAGAMLTTLGLTTFVKTLMDDASAGDFLTTLGISTFVKTLLDDASASAARTTLGVEILDEDDMSSDSNTKLSTQQSIKAYVTSQKLKVKVGNFTIDQSTTGTQVITGVGFTVTSVIFLAVQGNSPEISIGLGDTTNDFLIMSIHSVIAGNWSFDADKVIRMTQSSGNEAFAAVTTYGPDGFTITKTKDGSPTGTTIVYFMAFGN